MLAGIELNKFHHLETVRLGSSAASVEFTNLGQYSDYQHLQIRGAVTSSAQSSIKFRLNGSGSTTDYNQHLLYGTGSAVSPNAEANVSALYAGYVYDTPMAFVADLLDPFETTKFTTARSLSGVTASAGNRIILASSAWRNTAAVSSIYIYNESGSFTSGTRFSLYGLKVRA
jgi:hypothetical protein